MPISKLSAAAFLEMAKSHPVFDVRSEGEFEHAHIPDAFSLPIFNNSERAEIGTAYKKQGREPAIKIGLKYYGPKLNDYLQKVEEVCKNYSSKTILLHCWRGGMRSGAMAWLLSFSGFDVYLLDGGYKAYRNFVLDSFSLPLQYKVLGGFTGSAKTEILQELGARGFAMVDLEGIAKHKGSSFGALGTGTQPTQEQFENNLHQAFSKFYSIREEGIIQEQKILVENESQRIGLVNLPKVLFENIMRSDLVILESPFEQRLDFICSYYGNFSKEELIDATLRIQKRLGGLETKNVVQYLEDGQTREAFKILLQYYDRNYLRYSNFEGRGQIRINSDTNDILTNTELILKNIS